MQSMMLAKADTAFKVIFICVMQFSIIFFASSSSFAFANVTQNESTKELPLDQSNMKTEDVIAWATEAMEATFTYSFDDQSRLQSAKKYYTAKEWSAYMRFLDESENIKRMIPKKQKRIAKVIEADTSKSKIISEGSTGGVYTWKLEFPVLSSILIPPYNEDDEATSRDIEIVTLVIQRQPLHQGYKGLAITSGPIEMQPECHQIIQACRSAGFVEGENSQGIGLWDDCACPIFYHQPEPVTSKKKLPAVSAETVNDCRSRNPGFCRANREGS